MAHDLFMLMFDLYFTNLLIVENNYFLFGFAQPDC